MGLETEFWWKFRKAVMHVHLDAIIFSATLVRWLEGATISWAIEGEEFIKSVAEAAKCTARSIYASIWSRFTTVLVLLANNLFWNLDETIHDVAERTAKLARGRVSGSWGRVDVGDDDAGQDCEG